MQNLILTKSYMQTKKKQRGVRATPAQPEMREISLVCHATPPPLSRAPAHGPDTPPPSQLAATTRMLVHGSCSLGSQRTQWRSAPALSSAKKITFLLLIVCEEVVASEQHVFLQV